MRLQLVIRLLFVLTVVMITPNGGQEIGWKWERQGGNRMGLSSRKAKIRSRMWRPKKHSEFETMDKDISIEECKKMTPNVNLFQYRNVKHSYGACETIPEAKQATQEDSCYEVEPKLDVLNNEKSVYATYGAQNHYCKTEQYFNGVMKVYKYVGSYKEGDKMTIYQGQDNRIHGIVKEGFSEFVFTPCKGHECHVY